MWQHALSLVALSLATLAGFASWQAPAWPPAFQPPAAPPACVGRQTYETRVMRMASPAIAHVASAIALRDGRLRSFWYEGTRELAPDVRIMTATYADGRWSEARAVLSAGETSHALGRYVRKLGNAVPYRDSHGDLVLLFAGSLAGWSVASLNLMRSADDGETWSSPRRLVTSPMFNISTLVRAPPILMTDGSAMVPAYDETVDPFPVVFVLGDDGRVVGRRRIGATANALQPHLVRLSAQAARVYARGHTGGYAMVSETTDAGRSWSPLTPLVAPRINNQVAVQALDTEGLLIVYNDIIPGMRTAGQLMMALSSDGGASWRVIQAIDPDSARYPWLMTGPDNHYHLLYTRFLSAGSELVHIRFSRDWLAAHGGPPCA